MNNEYSNTNIANKPKTFLQLIVRFITAGIVLAITAFFTPSFTIDSIWALAFSSVILTIADFFIVKFTSLHTSPFGKGFVGFILAALVLYVTQFFVTGYTISWISAIIGALVYGVVDYFISEE